MAEHVIEDNAEEREQLLPVVVKIVGVYLTLLVGGYFVGNLIYQIP